MLNWRSVVELQRLRFVARSQESQSVVFDSVYRQMESLEPMMWHERSKKTSLILLLCPHLLVLVIDNGKL